MVQVPASDRSAAGDGVTIDVMIPFWGDPELLFEAIGSVRAQTDPNWRLTVVDDCYPESVAQRMAELGDDRLRYVRNERNVGITNNFRRCIESASADIVVLMGCDDLMLPNYVATVRAAAQACPRASLIQPGVEVIDQSGATAVSLRDLVKARLVRPRSDRPLLLTGQRAAASLLRGNWLYWPSLAFRRRDLAGVDFRDSFPVIQDLAFVMDLILAGGSLLYVPTVCFRYRRHAASASSSAAIDGSRFEGERRYLALAERLTRAKGWRRAAGRARWRLLSRLDALTIVPGAIASRQWAGLALLLRHVVGFGAGPTEPVAADRG
ncbi:MAG: glycosyltransferase [Propionibacteriaceae bacterium]|jgi:glycosyltransferase involved in cell wall biosynthesis|nr:glycosyltransferase [Propionibacteriaceae bacterium]